jgi:hypothetical protein
MSTERRPARPTTARANPAKAPTQRVAPVAPQQKATARVQAVQKPSGQRPTTRTPRTDRQPTRSVPTARKGNTGLVIGASVGGFVLLIVIIAVAMSGGKRPADASHRKSGPAPVDVTQLEAQGMQKCEEGCAIIQRAYGTSNKSELQKGIALITAGNELLDKANQMSGNKYDTKRFNETLKMARGKVLELK